MPAITREELDTKQTYQTARERERARVETIPALLGTGTGTIAHATRADCVYIRPHGQADKICVAKNASAVPKIENLPIDVLRHVRQTGGGYEVVGVSSQILAINTSAGFVSQHNTQHIIGDRGTGGFDPVYVTPRMILPLRARAQAVAAMTVYVEAGRYYANGWKYFAGGSTQAFTAPGTGSLWYLLSINADGTFNITATTENAYNDEPDWPAFPTAAYPIAFVYLASTTTAIQDTAIADARVFSAVPLRPGTALAAAVCVFNTVVCLNDEIVYIE